MSKQRTFLRFALALLGSFAMLALFPALVQGQTFELKWGSFGSGDGQFDDPTDVAADAFGNVYVADQDNNRIQKFDSSGNFLAKWGASGPQGVVVDASGNVYVAETTANQVKKFDSNGNLLNSWVTQNLPVGLALDVSGNLYVGNLTSATIQIFDSNGIPITSWNASGTIFGVAVDGSGNVFVSDISNNNIQKYNSAGTLLTQWGSTGSGDGQFNLPTHIAVDASGNVYVTERDNHRVQKFDNNGGFITKWGTLGTGDGQFESPKGISVDASYNVYVAEVGPNTSRIQKFSQAPAPVGAATHVSAGEFADFTLVYDLDIPNDLNTSVVGTPPYTIDNSAAITPGSFNRIAYYLELNDGSGPQFVWVSMDAFTTDPAQTGVPTVASGAVFQTTIANMNVESNVAGIVTGSGISTGNIEFWPFSYGTAALGGIGGSSTLFDFDDQNGSAASYGSMQIHNYGAGQTLLAYNRWSTADQISADDLGIGNNVIPNVLDGLVHPDWTFQLSTGAYTTKVLQVYAGSSNQPVEVSLPTVTATYNQALTIPVSISDASSLVAAEVTVEYDTDLLTLVTPAPAGVSSTGTLTDGWSVQYNTEAGAGTLEKVKIAVATDVNVVTGPATLINLHFTVNNVRLPDFSALSLSDVLLNDGTPPNVTVDGSVTLVGNDATIVFSSGGSPIPRESITVVVTDADADLTSGAGNDNVSVTITNLNNGDVINATLPEDGTLAGTFSLVVPTEFGLAAVVDATIQAKAGDDIDFTFVDQLDANGNGPIPRTIVANVIGGTDGTIVSTIVTQPGDAVYIRVTDADLNTDDGLQESVVVTALSSTTESENNIVLTEDGIDSDIFFGSVATTTGAIPGPNNDGPFHTQKGDVLTITYDDVVTAVGDQLNRVDDDEVVDPFGDADGNGAVQAFDAAKVLLHSLSPFLTGLDSLSANLDTQAFDPVFGKISPFDASLVLQKRVGLISIFPIQEDEADNHPQPQTNNSVPKALPDLRLLSLQPNGDYVSVWADQRAGILSGDLLIEDLVGQVEMAPELSHFLSASQVGQEGLHIVFAGAQEVSGPGELMRIYPGVGPDKAQLTRAQFNDGRIVGWVEALAAPVAIPATFALHANYPNPFNPETTIAFDLPQAGRVELQVFDLLGQTVRTLLAQELSAGGHQVVWNGLDASGARVSSGVYFYRLQAGSQVQMRRMLLLK